MTNVVHLRPEPASVLVTVSLPGDLYHELCSRAQAQKVTPEKMAALILRGSLTTRPKGVA